MRNGLFNGRSHLSLSPRVEGGQMSGGYQRMRGNRIKLLYWRWLLFSSQTRASSMPHVRTTSAVLCASVKKATRACTVTWTSTSASRTHVSMAAPALMPLASISARVQKVGHIGLILTAGLIMSVAGCPAVIVLDHTNYKKRVQLNYINRWCTKHDKHLFSRHFLILKKTNREACPVRKCVCFGSSPGNKGERCRFVESQKLFTPDFIFSQITATDRSYTSYLDAS